MKWDDWCPPPYNKWPVLDRVERQEKEEGKAYRKRACTKAAELNKDGASNWGVMRTQESWEVRKNTEGSGLNRKSIPGDRISTE